MKKIKLNYLLNVAIAFALILAIFFPLAGCGVGILAMAVGTRFSDTLKANAFNPQGIASYASIAYAASVNLPTPVQPALRHYFDFATLTGAITVNATAAMIAQLREGDEIIMQFVSDATGRTVTWGTNIRAGVAATLVHTASQVSIVKAMYMNGKIHIYAQNAAAA